MSTGVEHYAEAERLIAGITHAGALLPDNRVLDCGDHSQVLQLIQAHATLALAAATALGHREASDHEDSYGTSILPDDDYTAWWKAASEGPAARQRRQDALKAERQEFMAGYRASGRNAHTTSTADWYRESKAAGCTGTGYDTDHDAIIHDDAPPCPVHEPGDVVPAEDRLTSQPELYRDSFGRQHAKPWGAGF